MKMWTSNRDLSTGVELTGTVYLVMQHSQLGVAETPLTILVVPVIDFLVVPVIDFLVVPVIDFQVVPAIHFLVDYLVSALVAPVVPLLVDLVVAVTADGPIAGPQFVKNSRQWERDFVVEVVEVGPLLCYYYSFPLQQNAGYFTRRTNYSFKFSCVA